ncbi:MAG: TetR/AcrR family transcriptional regulator [Acidimicrobiales bacterium]|nr:MAG: TetR/AcrR family transcriptional regulator [Acidimicrobiales bacterium]
MSGLKQYDRTELLDRAMDLFHRQGFNGTSTAELVTELGVNRKSMYAEFGSKQGLFEAALDHYNAHSLSAVLSATEADGATTDAIRSTFAGFASASENWAQGRGCLLCNTAVERATLDAQIGTHVDAYFDRLTTAFRHALQNGQDSGEISTSSNLDDLAAFFTLSLIGVAASAKGNAHPDQIHAACRVVLNVLDTHRPG